MIFWLVSNVFFTIFFGIYIVTKLDKIEGELDFKKFIKSIIGEENE